MKTFWALVAVITTIILFTTTIVSAQGQDSPAAQMEAGAGWPNQVDEAQKRNTRQLFGGRGGGGELEMLACDILCPDDDPGFVPYRAPRPTKGSFVPIRG